MTLKNINKSEKFLATIEAEHHASRDKIAQGDLKTPSIIVNDDINIILNDLSTMTNKDAMKIKFFDNSVGYGSSLLAVKKKLLEKGIPEKHVVEKQLFGMDIDPDKILATRLVIDPERVYNISKNIIVGDSSKMSFTEKGLTHSWNNEPYLRGDEGKTPMYKDIIFNVEKQNPIQTSEAHLLPYAICLSSSHKDLLNYFFKKGLEHIRLHGYDAFGDAIVNTASYICNSGYKGEIKCHEKNRPIYNYNFRKLGFIIPGGSTKLSDLLVRFHQSANSMTVKMQINKSKILRPKKEKFKNSVAFLESRSKTFETSTVTFVDSDKVVHHNDLNLWKVVWGYRPGGNAYTPWKPNFVTVIPPMVAINDIYVYQSFETEAQARNRAKLFELSLITDWILKRSRTQLTFDAKQSNNMNQLSFLPNIDPNLKINSDEELIKYFKKIYKIDKDTVRDLEKEIEYINDI